MVGKASVLIYTKERHIGFPGGWFKVQPEDFSAKTVKPILEYAMNAMEEVKPLRSEHKQVEVVVAESGYVVLGIACYLRDLFSDGWEGVDEVNRPVYGFIGYVWKQKDFTQVCTFPSLTEFAELVAEYIRPNWELSKNAAWAEHQELVPYRYLPGNARKAWNDDFKPAHIEVTENADRLVRYAIQRAAAGEAISVCTNVTIYDLKDEKTAFQYVSRSTPGQKPPTARRIEKNSGGGDTGNHSRAGNEKDLVSPGLSQSESSYADTGRTNEAGGRNKAATVNGGDQADASGSDFRGKKVSILLIAVGAVLLISVIVSITAGWMSGLLLTGTLAAAVVCMAAGLVGLAKARKLQTNKHGLNPINLPNEQQPPSSVDANSFRTEGNKIPEPLMPAVKREQKAAQVKRPEDETTEDLFKF